LAIQRITGAWLVLVLALALGLAISPRGSLASGGDAIESKPGGLPVAEEHGDLTDLARHLNNPVGPVWNIVTQNNWFFQKGFPSTVYRVQYVMNFQPVLPIPLTRELNLVMRPVVPLESTPYASGVDVTNRTVAWSRAGGLGDITLEPFLVPNWKPWFDFWRGTHFNPAHGHRYASRPGQISIGTCGGAGLSH